MQVRRRLNDWSGKMTRKYIVGFRPAIAMVELVFAITIMGIALMAVPNLLSVSMKSGFVTLQQEAISEASAHISAIMTYAWDENNTNESFIPPILEVSNGDSELDDTGDGLRAGTPKESYRKFITSGGFKLIASASLGKESGEIEPDDIDDFNGETTGLTLVESADSDYVDKNVTMSTVISYADDSTNYNSNTITFTPFQNKTGTTNIKDINITLTSGSGVSELAKTIVLKAFSCNIGSYELEKKRF